MSAVILTWNDDLDIRLVKDEEGEPRIFYCAMNASGWIEENDSLVESMVKVVDLDD